MCFSLVDAASFTHLTDWIQNVRAYAEPWAAMVIVGTKLDLVTDETRAVSKEDAEQLAADIGAGYFETSAKDNVNIVTTIDTVVAMALVAEESAREAVINDVPVNLHDRSSTTFSAVPLGCC